MDIYHKLHDAFLDRLVVDWGHATGSIELEIDEGIVRSLRFSGLSYLTIPRQEPWGPSSWINAVEGPKGVDNGVQLRIEMQSGDVIEIVAQDFLLDPWD